MVPGVVDMVDGGRRAELEREAELETGRAGSLMEEGAERGRRDETKKKRCGGGGRKRKSEKRHCARRADGKARHEIACRVGRGGGIV